MALAVAVLKIHSLPLAVFVLFVLVLLLLLLLVWFKIFNLFVSRACFSLSCSRFTNSFKRIYFKFKI